MTRKQSTATYDPRNAEWSGTSIEDWEPSKWKQWKPKATGTDYLAVVEREYLKMRYAVQQVNDQLDIAGVKVKLKLTTSKSIGLQGTFPCKPGDLGKNGSPNKQYTISLGIAANEAGVKTAEAKARELDLWLMTKQFQWTPELLGKQAQKIAITDEGQQTKLISESIKEYELEFWKTHEENRQGLKTWKDNYLKYLNKLPQDVVLSKDALIQAFDKTRPNSPSRRFLVWQLKKFCDFCGFDAVKISDSYASSNPKPKQRQLPTDAEIIGGFNKIGAALDINAKKSAVQPNQWQWIYGMLATYGLRPHELFAIDLKAFTNSSNIYHLVTLDPSITDGTKTGERKCGIPPLKPEWVELFDLKNIKPISLTAKLNHKVKTISARFRAVKMNFFPYDLRHAYAVRGHRLRVPVKTMADYMGHTVQEHTKTYQRWMDRDTNLEIYKEVVIDKQALTKEELKAENELLKVENRMLATEIESLKTENESLKALLTRYQLDGLLNH